MQTRRLIYCLLILSFPVAIASCAEAANPFPYSVRQRDYSAWSPSSRGDTNTIGMGGATLALPSSISAAEANPAGYSMVTGSVSAQINKTSIHDEQFQRSDSPIRGSQWGLGISPPPWGFSFAYYSPITESGEYISPVTGRTIPVEVSLREYRLTAARSFREGKLAIGLSLKLLTAVRELGAESYNSGGIAFHWGALYKLPAHLVIGAVYVPRVVIGPDTEAEPTPELPGFNRSLISPGKFGLGFGWIPNRFFKSGVSLTRVTATADTALLADQSILTGSRATWVPRVGASYVFAEYQNFRLEGAVGAYYDMSRLSDQSDRLHATMGLEANPYFLNFGAGFDLSRNYRNLILSVGIDLVRTLRTFDIIPKDTVPALNGAFPTVDDVSADGLPEGMTVGEPKEFPAATVENVGKIIEDVPENVIKKVSGEPTTVEVQEKKEEKAEKKADARDKARAKAKRKRRSMPLPSPSPSVTSTPVASPSVEGRNSGVVNLQ